MNKGDLINKIADSTGATKRLVNSMLDSFMDVATAALKKGDRVVLVDFGTFLVQKHQARKGRNPQTGAEINIPARKVVKFSMGLNLSNKIK